MNSPAAIADDTLTSFRIAPATSFLASDCSMVIRLRVQRPRSFRGKPSFVPWPIIRICKEPANSRKSPMFLLFF